MLMDRICFGRRWRRNVVHSGSTCHAACHLPSATLPDNIVTLQVSSLDHAACWFPHLYSVDFLHPHLVGHDLALDFEHLDMEAEDFFSARTSFSVSSALFVCCFLPLSDHFFFSPCMSPFVTLRQLTNIIFRTLIPTQSLTPILESLSCSCLDAHSILFAYTHICNLRHWFHLTATLGWSSHASSFSPRTPFSLPGCFGPSCGDPWLEQRVIECFRTHPVPRVVSWWVPLLSHSLLFCWCFFFFHL